MRADGQPLESAFKRISKVGKQIQKRLGSVIFEDTVEAPASASATPVPTTEARAGSAGTAASVRPEQTRVRFKADGEFTYLRNLVLLRPSRSSALAACLPCVSFHAFARSVRSALPVSAVRDLLLGERSPRRAFARGRTASAGR